jgi:leucyl/phenylalanyl-tRNA--protein transferase
MAEFDARDLLDCYARGVFPMADARDDDAVFLIDPERRGVIPLERFHVSRRLARTVRADPFEVRVDSAFHAVVRACAESTPGRLETWINHPIEHLYGQLHDLGHAHSVECWQDGVLVGGLYGVSLKAAFFGESMFSRCTDASKVALVHLVARLIGRGYRLLDTQFMNDHLTQFGTQEISRAEYHQRLAAALGHEAQFQGLVGVGAATTSGKGLAAEGASGLAAGGAAGLGAAGAGFAAGAAAAGAGTPTGAVALQVISQAS